VLGFQHPHAKTPLDTGRNGANAQALLADRDRKRPSSIRGTG
jgi:hypothetical protein